jgi:proline iminopeptidase
VCGLLLVKFTANACFRKFYGVEKFVLAGASYGAFLALDYAVRHGDRLDGLILRGAWANGKLGPMNALANILTSDKVKVDTDRQVRLWSGTLRNDQDFEDSIMELLPFYAPPRTAGIKDIPESTEFQGTVKYHSATQNYAFSVNMPQFDVRDKLQLIKVCIIFQYQDIKEVWLSCWFTRLQHMLLSGDMTM